jgi:hypothetical protein
MKDMNLQKFEPKQYDHELATHQFSSQIKLTAIPAMIFLSIVAAGVGLGLNGVTPVFWPIETVLLNVGIFLCFAWTIFEIKNLWKAHDNYVWTKRASVVPMDDAK